MHIYNRHKIMVYQFKNEIIKHGGVLLEYIVQIYLTNKLSEKVSLPCFILNPYNKTSKI